MPEIRQIKKKETEFILIACDGVWECISTPILMSCIQLKLKNSKEPENLKLIIEDMLHKLVAPTQDFPKGYDNMTAILIVFS
jgi:serine/threonine protein phosphatase PrpC